MRFLFTCFALLLVGTVPAQHWARRVGAWSNDAYADLVVDATGNLYAVGEFGGNIVLNGATLISQGSLDVVVAKYDISGNLLWAKTFGGPGLDRAIKVALTNDGHLAVVGQFMGSAQFDGTTLISQGGTQDLFVLKMAQGDGALAWVRQGGSADGVDQPNGVSVGPDGSIAVAGEFRGTAVFDMGTISSIIDPDNGLPSVDIFLAAYASDGTPLWLKHGAARYADRAIDVAHDPLGNIYLTGQFSDTLTIDQTHNNEMFSAVFIARFDAAGSEQWFRVFGGGTYNQVFEIQVVSGDRLMLVGDVQGTVIFLDSQPDLFTAVAPRSSFLLEVGLDGELLRQTTWGSDNALNTRALSIQGDDVVVLGRFACQFTGFSAIYGNGVFLATGAHDLYAARFRLSDLGLASAQQFGGQGDKVPGGIVHTPDSGYVFTGSYEYTLVFPSRPGFDAEPSGLLQTAPAPSPYCSDPDYGHYTYLRGSALKDAFIARGYDVSRAPYDMFRRTGSACDRDALDGYITVGDQGLFGPDSVARCHTASLYAYTPTAFTPDTVLRHNAPDLSYLWSTGQTLFGIVVNTTGWYRLTITSEAGCWQRTDSIHITINPLPPQLLVNDDVVVNVNALPPQPIVVCEPEEPWLWITGQPAQNTIHWNGPTGLVLNDSTHATQTGLYAATATTPAGCVRSTVVDVTIEPSGPLPPIDIQLLMNFPQDEDLDDTAFVCENDFVSAIATAVFVLDGDTIGLPYGVSMFGSCEYGWAELPDPSVPCNQLVNGEGWYTFNIGFLLTNAPCGSDTLFRWITDSIYVVPLQVEYPQLFASGPALICPGDTAILVGTCANCSETVWSGSGIVQATTDSIWIAAPGVFTFSGNVLDTNACLTTDDLALEVQWNPLPLLAVDPSDGIICPNGTATIWSESQGLSYQWYGPLGPLSVDNDTIITSQQGFYYVEMIDSLQCEVTSDPILITDYATPFLNVLPDGVLCEPGETALLQVVTTSTATLAWAAPFEGSSSVQQVVTQPGIYTCSVTACGIVTDLSVQIFGNTADAELLVPGPFTLCPGESVTLEATPGAAVYYWFPGPLFGPEITTDTSGTYLLVVTNANGCQDSLFTEVTVLPAYEVLSLADTSACAGEAVVVNAAGDGDFVWYADPFGSQPIGTGPTLDLGVLWSDTTVHVVQQVGICSSGFVQVDVNVHAPPTAPIVLGDTSLCEGSTLLLTVVDQPDAVFTWSGPSGQVAGTALNIPALGQVHAGTWTVTASNPACAAASTSFEVVVIDAVDPYIGNDTLICPGGVATFTLPNGFQQPLWSDASSGNSFTSSIPGPVWVSASDTNGCSVSDTALVMVFSFTSPLTVTGATICLGASAVLQASGSGSIAWSSTADMQNVVHTGSSWTIEQPSDSAVYHVQQTEGSCSSSVLSVPLNVVPVPVDVQLRWDLPVCAGDTLIMELIGANDPWGVWSTPSGDFQGGVLVINGSDATDEGLYAVVPFIGNCAGDTLTAFVDVLVPLPFSLGVDTSFCEGGVYSLVVPQPWSQPLWSTGSEARSIEAYEAGTYRVQAYDAQGCRVQDEVRLGTVDCGTIIPNVFTPNGDGTNDVWLLGPGGYRSAVLEVYNRWGQRVWEGDAVHKGFRGEHMDNGEPLPDGTYFYVLQLVRGNGDEQHLTGHFTLLR